MNKYTLPKSVEIDGIECGIDSDFRNILQIFNILHDPDLLPQESYLVSLEWFYTDKSYLINITQALKEMFTFISCCNDTKQSGNCGSNESFYDWNYDFNIIVAPVNQILGYDVRGVEYLHWWTFMSAFMQISESTFSTYVNIRKKLARGIKLDKQEEKVYKEHCKEITLPKRYDKATQELMDLIMGEEE